MDYPKNPIFWFFSCPCGSKRRFKRCCYNLPTILEPQIVTQIHKRNFQKVTCLAPEVLKSSCNGKCAAHSIAKMANLTVIADGGHLYNITHNIYDLRGIFIDTIGINKASTFNGFCSEHDRSLFQSIDTGHYSSSPEQAFLLLYRGFCKELYAKQAMITSTKECIEMIGQSRKRFFKEKLQIDEAVLSDLLIEKNQLDNDLINQEYNVVFVEIVLNAISPIVAASYFYPFYDLNLKLLQDADDFKNPAKGIGVSVINQGGIGRIIFVSLENNKPGVRFLESLETIPQSLLPKLILNFLFEFTENIYFKISWWDSQKDEVRNFLLNKFRDSIGKIAISQNEFELARIQKLHDPLDLLGDFVKVNSIIGVTKL